MTCTLNWVVAMLLIVPHALSAADVDEREQREALRKTDVLIEERYVGVDKVWELRAVSGDGHLGLSCSEEPITEPDGDEAPLTLNDGFEKWYGAGVNHGVEKIERLEGNVMLPDPLVPAEEALDVALRLARKAVAD